MKEYPDVSGIESEGRYVCEDPSVGTDDQCASLALKKEGFLGKELLPVFMDGKIVVRKCPYCRGKVKKVEHDASTISRPE